VKTEKPTPDQRHDNVALCWEHEGLKPQAQALADRYGFQCAGGNRSQPHFFLTLTEKRLELRPNTALLPQLSSMGSIFTDFVNGPYGFRRSHSHGRNELVIRAAGPVTHAKHRTLFDATAGLGRDGFLLAAHGWQVTMVERSAVTAALLADGLQRALVSPATKKIAQRITCIHADSVTLLSGLAPPDFPDVIYLDPMFPERTKKALVKKEMRILQLLLGPDMDADLLFHIACRRANQRVVVKRSKAAPCLAQKEPHRSIAGRSHRFDIYLRP